MGAQPLGSVDLESKRLWRSYLVCVTALESLETARKRTVRDAEKILKSIRHLLECEVIERGGAKPSSSQEAPSPHQTGRTPGRPGPASFG